MDAKALAVGALGAFSVMGLWLGLFWQGPLPWARPPEAQPEAQRQTREQSARVWAIGPYQVELRETVFVDDGALISQSLLVRRGEVEALRFAGARIVIEGWLTAPPETPFPEFATNLTGGANPQLVVQRWTGESAECCLAAEIVDLGPDVVARIALPGGGAGRLHLAQQDSSPAFEAIISDPAFAVAQPQLVMRLTEGVFRPAPDLMRRLAPTPDEIRAKAALIRADQEWNGDGPPTALTREFLALAYSGNLAVAGTLFDAAWKPEIPGREEARRALELCALRASLFWPDIAQLNGVPPDPPAEGCAVVPAGAGPVDGGGQVPVPR